MHVFHIRVFVYSWVLNVSAVNILALNLSIVIASSKDGVHSIKNENRN